MPNGPTDARHSIGEEIKGVAMFVAAIWIVFFISSVVNLNAHFALVPRTVRGIPGIIAMPFLHGGLGHLISNTTPLFILLTLLAGSRARSWWIVTSIILLSGILLWLFGTNGNSTMARAHVGASGLVFGLITFLLVGGFLEKRLGPLLIGLLVGFFYGGTLLFGVLPIQQGVSWDGHLCGAIAGVLVAFLSTRTLRAVNGQREL
jgi:membrane associated rhomboid family serine protease